MLPLSILRINLGLGHIEMSVSVKHNAKDKKQTAFCTSLLMMLSASEAHCYSVGCSNCASFIVYANRTGVPGNTFSPLTQENCSTILYIQEKHGDRPGCTHFLHWVVTPLLGQLCLYLSQGWVALCTAPPKASFWECVSQA